MPMLTRRITTKNLIRLSYAKRLQLVRLTRKENAFYLKLFGILRKKKYVCKRYE